MEPIELGSQAGGEILSSTDSSDTQSYKSEASTSKRQCLPVEPKGNSKKKRPNTLENVDTILMEQAIACMNQKPDEYDIFGQFVASELRQIFDLVKRNEVKRSIMTILITQGASEQTTNGFTSEILNLSIEALEDCETEFD